MFGDPSEAGKNDVLEQSDLRIKDVESEVQEEYNRMRVLDADNEREVVMKKIEGEVTSHSSNVASDTVDSAVTNMASENVNSAVMPSQKMSVSFDEFIGSSAELLEESKDVNNVESGAVNVVIDDSSEDNLVEIISVLPPTEAEPILDEEAGSIAVDDSVEEDMSTQLPEPILNEEAVSIAVDDSVKEDTPTQLSKVSFILLFSFVVLV